MSARTAEKRFGALGRMGIVVAFHAALLLVLARGFGVVPKFVDPGPLIGEVIDDSAPKVDPEPPIGPPQIIDQKIYIPPPDEVVAEQDPPPPPDAIGGTKTGGETGAGGSALPQPVIESVRMDARHPLTQPPYPMVRIRNNDEGAVDLQVYVLPNGRVGDARVLKSSGFEDFDRAAMQEARRSWRMIPATRDGVPFAQWYSLRVVFKLKNSQ